MGKDSQYGGSSGSKTVSFHRQENKNKQNLSQSCCAELNKNKSSGKFAEKRIPLECLDKRTLITQYKALEEYICRLLEIINLPGEDLRQSELNNLKVGIPEESEPEENAKAVTENIEPVVKRKAEKANRKKRNKGRKKDADKRHEERNLDCGVEKAERANQTEQESNDVALVERRTEDFETTDQNEWKAVKHKGSRKRKENLKSPTEENFIINEFSIAAVKEVNGSEANNAYTPQVEKLTEKGTNVKVCRYYLNGNCKFGSQCWNIHGKSIYLYCGCIAGNEITWVQTEDELRMCPINTFCAKKSVDIVNQYREPNEPILLILRYRIEKNRGKFYKLAQKIQAIDNSIAVKVNRINRISTRMVKFAQGCRKMAEKGRKLTISLKREKIMDVKNESILKSVLCTTKRGNENYETDGCVDDEWKELYAWSEREAIKDEALRQERLDRTLGVN